MLFRIHMDLVFLVYGLSFLAMALVISVANDRHSSRPPAKNLWLLAAFGLVHGLLEWLDLWMVVYGPNATVKDLQPFLLLGSFLLLFEFGRRTLFQFWLPAQRPAAVKWGLSPGIYAPMGLALLLGTVVSGSSLPALGVWSRYLIGFPGSWLSALGFIACLGSRVRPLATTMNPRWRWFLATAAAALFVYGLSAGLVVPKLETAGALLDQDRFLAMFGFPVQLLRAACAVVLAVSLGGMLKGFQQETFQQLQKATREAGQAKNELSATLRAIPDLMFEMDEAGRYLRIHASDPSLLAASQEQLLGRTVNEVLPKEAARLILETLAQAKLQGSAYGQAIHLPLPNGGHWFELSVTRKTSSDDMNPSFVVLSRDITGRRQAEQALQASRERYRIVVETISEIVWTMDLAGNFTYISPAVERLRGYTAKEAMQLSLEETLTPASLAQAKAEIQRLLEASRIGDRRQSIVGEFEQYCKDGSTVWVDVSTTGLYHQDGELIGFVGVTRDATARKQAEQALLASEERYRLLADNANDIIWSMDIDRRITYFSPAVEKVLGYPMAEALRLTLDQLFTPASLSRASAEIQRALETVRSGGSLTPMIGEYEHVRKDGTVIWVEISNNGVYDHHGQLAGFSGVSRDITRRKQAEQALQASEERYRVLANAINDVIWSMDLDGRFTYISPSVERLRGYTAAEAMQQSLEQMMTAESFAQVQAEMRRMREIVQAGGHFPDSVGEFEQTCKDGSTVWVEVSTTGIYSQAGELTGIAGVSRDVSERRRIQRRLLALSTAMEQSPTSIVITDTEGRIRYVNPQFTKVTGYFPEEALGQNPRILKSEQTPASLHEEMWKTLAAGQPWSGELVNRRKSGEPYWEEAHIAPVKDAAGKTIEFVAVKLDITERKKSEERIARMAHHDTLTGLPNRILFSGLLENALALARRHQGRLALMFVDLDRFKPVNDLHGHAVGDLLLQEVAGRMKAAIRTSDTVARIGGDEFVVLLPEIAGPQDGQKVAEKIRQALATPYEIEGKTLAISSSIGIALYPEHGADEIRLSAHADAAMYQAKAAGRNAIRLYQPEQA